MLHSALNGNEPHAICQENHSGACPEVNFTLEPTPEPAPQPAAPIYSETYYGRKLLKKQTAGPIQAVECKGAKFQGLATRQKAKAQCSATQIGRGGGRILGEEIRDQARHHQCQSWPHCQAEGKKAGHSGSVRARCEQTGHIDCCGTDAQQRRS